MTLYHTPETILTEMRRLRAERDAARLAACELARVAAEWLQWYRSGGTEWIDPPPGLPEAIEQWKRTEGAVG